MIDINRKEGIRLPSRRIVLRGGAIAVALILAGGVGRGLILFPFDPVLSRIRLAVALVAVGLFFGAALFLMLGGSFVRRMAGAQGMAVAAGLVLIALAGDGVAWVAALFGWMVAAGMILWGSLLAGEIRPHGGGESKG